MSITRGRRTLGAEHGETGAPVGLEFEVDPRSGRRQGADYLGGERRPLEVTESREDGESWMEVDGHRVVAGVYDQSFEAHPVASARGGLGLEGDRSVVGRATGR